MNIAISCLNVELDKLGGVQNRLRYLIRGILERDHELNIIQTKKAYQASEDFYNHLDRIPKFILLSNPNNIKYPWAYIRQNSSRIGKKLIEERIDILDTYDPYIHLNNFAKPVIYTTNFFMDYVKELLRLGEIRYTYLHLLKCLIEGRLIEKADHFIIQNSIQKKRLLEYYGVQEDRISIIPTGFDSKVVENVTNQSISNYSNKIIMFSGRLSKYKGVYELIDAFTVISKDNPKWNLWLVGDGPDGQLLKNLVIKRGLSSQVRFLDSQSPSNTIKYTNMCDIFVFPSYIESIPGSLLEAMALGKPVVATDVGAIGEDIVNAESGILVPPKNTDKLKDGIIEMINDGERRKKYGQNGRNKVLGLTKENLVKNTIKVYERVVES